MIALLWILVAVNCISFAIFVFSAAAAIRRARRDYFAAKAMQAMITKSDGQSKTGGAAGVPLIAQYAYEFADAMEVARKTGGAA